MVSSSPAHRPSSREQALQAALALARTGAPVSLESASRAAGITKPGLMYHFATKAALMTALVDAAMDEVEAELVRRLGVDPGDAAESPVEDRLLAYVEWACTADFDAGDLVMFLDPRLREVLTARWAERIEPWLRIPDSVPSPRRARLLTARLAADGVWFGTASDALPLTRDDRAAVLALARNLISEDA